MFHCLVIKVPVLRQLIYFIISFCFCQALFYFFQKLFSKPFGFERRRRDLNPRAAINDLLPFQGSPFGQLGYFSKLPYYSEQLLYYIMVCRFCQALFLLFSKTFLLLSSNSFTISRFCFLVNNFFQNFFSFERREWDSNPRALADKRFSRPPRYDHFDISPYFRSLTQCEIDSNTILFICQELFLFFYIFL